MKTIKILIASLILVSQSYAFSNSERKILLGLGLGAVVAYAIHEDNRHTKNVHHTRTVYVDAHDSKRKHKQYAKHNKMNDRHHNNQSRHHAKQHRRDHRDMHHYERVAYNHPNHYYGYRY